MDRCHPSPCQNGGKCVDHEEDFHCACSGGFLGRTCEGKIEVVDVNKNLVLWPSKMIYFVSAGIKGSLTLELNAATRILFHSAAIFCWINLL